MSAPVVGEGDYPWITGLMAALATWSSLPDEGARLDSVRDELVRVDSGLSADDARRQLLGWVNDFGPALTSDTTVAGVLAALYDLARMRVQSTGQRDQAGAGGGLGPAQQQAQQYALTQQQAQQMWWSQWIQTAIDLAALSHSPAELQSALAAGLANSQNDRNQANPVLQAAMRHRGVTTLDALLDDQQPARRRGTSGGGGASGGAGAGVSAAPAPLGGDDLFDQVVSAPDLERYLAYIEDELKQIPLPQPGTNLTHYYRDLTAKFLSINITDWNQTEEWVIASYVEWAKKNNIDPPTPRNAIYNLHYRAANQTQTQPPSQSQSQSQADPHAPQRQRQRLERKAAEFYEASADSGRKRLRMIAHGADMIDMAREETGNLRLDIDTSEIDDYIAFVYSELGLPSNQDTSQQLAALRPLFAYLTSKQKVTSTVVNEKKWARDDGYTQSRKLQGQFRPGEVAALDAIKAGASSLTEIAGNTGYAKTSVADFLKNLASTLDIFEHGIGDDHRDRIKAIRDMLDGGRITYPTQMGAPTQEPIDRRKLKTGTTTNTPSLSTDKWITDLAVWVAGNLHGELGETQLITTVQVLVATHGNTPDYWQDQLSAWAGGPAMLALSRLRQIGIQIGAKALDDTLNDRPTPAGSLTQSAFVEEDRSLGSDILLAINHGARSINDLEIATKRAKTSLIDALRHLAERHGINATSTQDRIDGFVQFLKSGGTKSSAVVREDGYLKKHDLTQKLTPREHQLLDVIRGGATTMTEIMTAAQASFGSVRTYLSKLTGLLDISDRPIGEDSRDRIRTIREMLDAGLIKY